MLRIENLNKSFGVNKVLNNINLELENGVYGLLGPNGAGKTTLMRILTTIIDDYEGDIKYKNISWKQKDEVRKYIGYLPQKFSFYKNLYVFEALEHIGYMKGIEKNLKREVFSVLDMVNLTDAAKKKVGELSGGMLRRLGIAQALLGKPEILIVDEPTAGLDPEERLRFRNIVKNIKNSSIIIISTHIVEDVASTCDNVIIINKGDILKKGKIQDVKKSNKTYVWKVYISVEEFDIINKKFRVLEYEKREDGYDVKLLSNIKPMDTAKELEPTLEDVYMSIINEK